VSPPAPRARRLTSDGDPEAHGADDVLGHALHVDPGGLVKKFALFAAAAVAAVLMSFGGAVEAAQAAPAALAHTCGSGYKHAVIAGAHKCLRRGQSCSTRYDSQYHRYGYHCHTGRLR